MGKQMQMRAAILFFLSLYATGAPAASPEDAYLAARDGAITKIKQLEAAKADEPAISAEDEKARSDLEARLRDIIGPVSVKGFPTAGKLNLESLTESDVGFGMLDGLAYSAGEEDEVVVTTRPLLSAWLKGKAGERDKDLRLPADAVAAARLDAFFAQAIASDATFSKMADLPMAKPASVDFVMAKLGQFVQDIGPNAAGQIVMALGRGNRVYVAKVPRKAPIAKIPACEAIWAEAKRKADKLQAQYAASGLKDPKLFELSTRTEDQGDKSYRACFNERSAHEPFFAGVVKEAQDLANRMAGD